MAFTTKTNTRVFQKAGRFLLGIPKPDGTLDARPESRYASNGGVIEKIVTTMSFTNSQLADGNSNWPAGDYVTGTAGTAAITMSSFDEKLYAFLSGSTFAIEKQNQVFYEISLPITVEETVVLPGTKCAGTKTADEMILCDSVSGEEFKKATADAPAAAGEYKFDEATMTLTFHADDVGKAVYATFPRLTKASVLGQPSIANIPTLHMIVAGESTDINGTDVRKDNYVIDVCKLTGDLNPPERARTPVGWTFTVAIQKPRAGKQAVGWLTADDSDIVVP